MHLKFNDLAAIGSSSVPFDSVSTRAASSAPVDVSRGRPVPGAAAAESPMRAWRPLWRRGALRMTASEERLEYLTFFNPNGRATMRDAIFRVVPAHGECTTTWRRLCSS